MINRDRYYRNLNDLSDMLNGREPRSWKENKQDTIIIVVEKEVKKLED